jgi:hypothetical protein
LTIKDTLIVFVNTEIIIYDFNKTTGWFVGDLRDNIQVPSFASFTRVDPIVHKTNAIDGFISGGISMGYY